MKSAGYLLSVAFKIDGKIPPDRILQERATTSVQAARRQILLLSACLRTTLSHWSLAFCLVFSALSLRMKTATKEAAHLAQRVLVRLSLTMHAGQEV